MRCVAFTLLRLDVYVCKFESYRMTGFLSAWREKMLSSVGMRLRRAFKIFCLLQMGKIIFYWLIMTPVCNYQCIGRIILVAFTDECEFKCVCIPDILNPYLAWFHSMTLCS